MFIISCRTRALIVFWVSWIFSFHTIKCKELSWINSLTSDSFLVTLFFILILFFIETSGLYLFKNTYFYSYKPPIFHHFIGHLSTCSNFQSCNNRTIHSTLCYSCIQDTLIKDQEIQRGSNLNFPQKCYYVPSPHLYFHLKVKNVILNVAMCILIDISIKWHKAVCQLLIFL